MFRCQNCGKFVELGQPENKIITEYRDTNYSNLVTTRRMEKRYNLMMGESWQTTGREIVKEISVCPKCCIALTGQKPKVKRKVNPPKEHPKRKNFSKKYERLEPKKSHKYPQVEIVSKLKIEK